jgi:hypothetical protein
MNDANAAESFRNAPLLPKKAMEPFPAFQAAASHMPAIKNLAVMN